VLRTGGESPSAAWGGKSSYRLGLEQHCPLPIATVEKPAATRMLDIGRGANKTMPTAQQS